MKLEITSGFIRYYNLVQAAVYATAESKGFHDDDLWDWETLEALALLALIHTEVCEVTQLVKRHGCATGDREWIDAVSEELADIVIRIMDFAEKFGFDVATEIYKKDKRNSERPHRYGTIKEYGSYGEKTGGNVAGEVEPDISTQDSPDSETGG